MCVSCFSNFRHRSLSARRAWIQIRIKSIINGLMVSLSARRAWIEMVITAMTGQISVVALRKESVDRNLDYCDDEHTEWVALRKESVDRNCHSLNLPSSPIESLSARRAWIEIIIVDNSRLPINGRSPQGERG